MATSFLVRRREPQVIRPATATPYEIKELSDVDCQFLLRCQAHILLVYRSAPEETVEVARLLRGGIARALVHYYPLAGRLRKLSERKFAVECTGEGALFVEGEADFSVEELGVRPHGSDPYYRELIHDVPGSGGIEGCPLLLVQVTRLKCGGFTVGVRANHTLMDAIGKGQFLQAVAEMARGAATPSIIPVWKRELLSARDPPRVTRSVDHNEYDEFWRSKAGQMNGLGRMISKTFLFGSLELAAIRGSLPEGLGKCSTFEMLASFIWRSRVIAFDHDPEDEVRFQFMMNIRNKMNPPLPEGYYGNAIISACAVTAAGVLRENPLEYAISLVRKAKDMVSDGFMRSFIDLVAENNQPRDPETSFYGVSNLINTTLASTDFGWGKPVFVIPDAVLLPNGSSGGIDFYTPARGLNGEEQVMVPVILPERAMDRFTRLIDDLRIVKPSRL